MYKQNKSLHKINLWFILQYVKQNTISNTISFQSASNIILQQCANVFSLSIFYILIVFSPHDDRWKVSGC